MECKSCGAPIKEGEKSCSYCGKVCDEAVKSITPIQSIITQVHRVTTPSKDSSSLGYAIISFIFPLIGIILYCLFRNSAPLKAKSCKKGIFFGIITYVLLFIFSGIILYIAFSSFAEEIGITIPIINN